MNFHQLNKYQPAKTFRESLPSISESQNNTEKNDKDKKSDSKHIVLTDKLTREEENTSYRGEDVEKSSKTQDISLLKSQKCTMLSNPIESHYSREQDLRYTSLSDVSRSISSYAIDTVSSNRLTMPDYDVQTVHSTNHRPYDPGSLVNSQTAFERYDPGYPLQRTMYSSYGQPSLEELASQQKYLLEQHSQHQAPIMKTEPDNEANNGPIYPRPIYQSYDPTGKLRKHQDCISLISISQRHHRIKHHQVLHHQRQQQP